MWVKATAQFKPKSIADIVWENMNRDEQEDSCEPRDFRFDTQQLSAYNEVPNVGLTLRFKNGDDFTITMTIEEMDAIIFKINS